MKRYNSLDVVVMLLIGVLIGVLVVLAAADMAREDLGRAGGEDRESGAP